MTPLATLAQSLGVAYSAGISPYATVALLGLAQRFALVEPLPGALGVVGSSWVIAIAGAMALLEFSATLIPWVASLWETVHSVVRPPAAAALAVLTAWGGEPALLLAAAVLGGGLGLATHATKLGIRYTIDTSPEPLTNGAANVGELGVVAALSYFIWQYPFVALGLALLLLLVLMLVVRMVWRAFRQATSLFRRPGRPARGIEEPG